MFKLWFAVHVQTSSNFDLQQFSNGHTLRFYMFLRSAERGHFDAGWSKPELTCQHRCCGALEERPWRMEEKGIQDSQDGYFWKRRETASYSPLFTVMWGENMHINRNCFFRLERSWKYGWSYRIERVRLSKSYCDDDFVSAPSAHSISQLQSELFRRWEQTASLILLVSAIASLWSCNSPKLVTVWQVRQLTRKSVEGWSDSESDFGLWLSCHKTKRVSLAILSICFYTVYTYYFLHFYLRGPSYFSFISSACEQLARWPLLNSWCSGAGEGGGTQLANSDRFGDILGLFTLLWGCIHVYPVWGVQFNLLPICGEGWWRCLNKLHIQ